MTIRQSIVLLDSILVLALLVPALGQAKTANPSKPSAKASTKAASRPSAMKVLRAKPVTSLPQDLECWGDISGMECRTLLVDLNNDKHPELFVLDNNCAAHGCEPAVRVFQKSGNTWKEMGIETDEDEELIGGGRDEKGVIKIGTRHVNGFLEFCATVGPLQEEKCFQWNGKGWGDVRPVIEPHAMAVEPGKGMNGCNFGSEEDGRSLMCNDERIMLISDSNKLVGIATTDKEVMKSAGFADQTLQEAARLYPSGSRVCGVEVESLEGVMDPWEPDMDCRNFFEAWVVPESGIALLEAYNWTGISKYCDPGQWFRKLVVFPKGGRMPVGTPQACPSR